MLCMMPQASRVELRQALKYAGVAEQCAADQHAVIEELEAKLAKAATSTGSVGESIAMTC